MKTNNAPVPARRSEPYVRQATVVASGAGEPLSVVMRHDGRELRVQAILAMTPAPRLHWGDRVLVTGEDLSTCYVIGVVHTAAQERRLETRSGANARAIDHDGDERIEVRDAEDRLLFEYRPGEGRGVLTMPKGDLSLHAPEGDIELVSGGSIRCQAAESVSLSNGTSAIAMDREETSISARALKLASKRADVLFGEATYRGERFSAAVEQAKVVTRKLETMAGWVFARAKSVLRRVDDLEQLEAGRTRTVVEGSHYTRSGSATLEAERDVKIDGSSIHLG